MTGLSASELDELATAVAPYAGRVVLVGTSAEDLRARASTLIWKELSLLGSRGFTPDDIRKAIDLYLNHDIVVSHLLQRQRPLREANLALADLREGNALHTVLVP